MTEITRCNRIGFHYNGFLNVLDNSNPAYNAKSSIKILIKIYFCSNCGTWVKSIYSRYKPILHLLQIVHIRIIV